MARKKGIKNRRYDPQFKAEALAMAKAIGGNETAMRLGMPESSLWNWIKREAVDKAVETVPAPGQATTKAVRASDPSKNAKRVGAGKASQLSPTQSARHQALAQENTDLKRRLADAQADLAILKKAAAYFARESK
jgi:transposase